MTDNGSEALVVVLEQAYNLRLRALRAIHESIREIVSDLWLRAASGESVDVPGGGNLVDFLDDLEQRNLGALESFERHPVALCFEGAGLGRGQGAIDTRLRKICREGLESRVEVREVVLDPERPECVAQAMDVHRCHFRVPRLRDGKVEMEVRRESLVFAFALDGEKALSLPVNALERLAAHRGALPLVIEENLIGCGLRGDLYAFERTPLATARPEYIVLNKLFAGWGAKIGAALVRDDSVGEGFDNSCAAGFGEDEFSLEVALAVFDALDAVDRKQGRGGAATGAIA